MDEINKNWEVLDVEKELYNKSFNLDTTWINIMDEYPEIKPIIDDYYLTESSPRLDICHPNIVLWIHQKAMLYRIARIEKIGYLCRTVVNKTTKSVSSKVCLGIMNDPPGSGKTYAILMHVLLDTSSKATVIISPQNIYMQWKNAIKLIFNNSPNCLFSESYADILNIYGHCDVVNSYKVILLQDTFAESYLKVLNENRIRIRRIIIDESDIMDKYVHSHIDTDFVWLISATYSNQTIFGSYVIEDYRKVICKCSERFVELSIVLPEIIFSTIYCDDLHIQLFKDIIGDKILTELHKCDHNILNRNLNISGNITPADYVTIAKKYTEYLSYEKSIVLKNRIELFNETNETNVNMCNNYKEAYFETIIIPMILNTSDSTNDLDTKWLVFNENDNVLIKYQRILDSNRIVSRMLDGGNYINIDRIINEYKYGNIQVLLLNSVYDGYGINLENTTHLLFMHKTNELYKKQLIGRAQRFGRLSQLTVITMLNKSE